MAVGDTFRRWYEKDGTVRRRVMKDLGGGQRVVVSDTLEHPDIKVFMEEQPDARVRGYHPETEMDFPSPETFTVSELEGYLSSLDSVDVLLRMRELDSRVTADALYEERIQQILGIEPEEDGEPEDDIVEDGEALNSEEEEDSLSDNL